MLQLHDYVSGESTTVRKLFKEVEKLLHLIMVQPCSNASSERSFSALKRLKTYMRSTMTQSRLTHLALMSVHKEIVQDINQLKLQKYLIFWGALCYRTFAIGDRPKLSHDTSRDRQVISHILCQFSHNE